MLDMVAEMKRFELLRRGTPDLPHFECGPFNHLVHLRIFLSALYSKNFWREKQERTLKNIRFSILKTLLYQGFPADETTKQP